MKNGLQTLMGECDTTQRDMRNQLRFLVACLAWAILFAGATFVMRRELVGTGPLAWVVATLPTLGAIAVALTYAHFLRYADELQRQIQLKALALGFGAAWVAICGYPLFEPLGAPAAEADDYFLVMVAAFALGSILGWRKYR